MPASKEQLDKIRHLSIAAPNTGKRGPNKKTLMKREARERALEAMKEMYKAKLIGSLPDIAEVQMEEAKKPEKTSERIYVLDRALGEISKSPQAHLHLHKHENDELTEVQRKLIEEYENKLKEIKTANAET